MTNGKTSTDRRFFDPLFAAKNTAVGFILTIILLFAASWIAALCAMPYEATKLITEIITYLCVSFCGFRAARHNGSNGMLSGAFAGFVYILLLFTVGCCAFWRIHMGTSELLTWLICILCGAVGGVVGINTASRAHRK